eukprot:953579-Pelagomonas_calceolata.AAC.1
MAWLAVFDFASFGTEVGGLWVLPVWPVSVVHGELGFAVISHDMLLDHFDREVETWAWSQELELDASSNPPDPH